MEYNVHELKRTTLAKVPDNQQFFVCRGDRISNITDLANCIASLSPDQFKHHASKDRNDFANWIKDVLKNPLLARDLHYDINIRDQKHCVKTIRDHIAWLQSV